MPTIHLLEGPVGAGKSTYAQGLGEQSEGSYFNLDDWVATLFLPDRPAAFDAQWYDDCKTRCIQQIWKLSLQMLNKGSDVVLELGLIRRTMRQLFYDQVDDTGYSLIVYVLDAPRKIRFERVKLRNLMQDNTYSMEIPDRAFDLASNLWEPPDDRECLGRDIRFISTDLNDLIV